MVGTGDTGPREQERAARRAARELIATYHQRELRDLLEHVREGFARLDAGEIDEFELDDLVITTSDRRTSSGSSAAPAAATGNRQRAR